jgi:hypothetical protein
MPAEKKGGTVDRVCPADLPANMKLAAKEIRRYLYLRTGALPAISPLTEK